MVCFVFSWCWKQFSSSVERIGFFCCCAPDWEPAQVVQPALLPGWRWRGHLQELKKHMMGPVSWIWFSNKKTGTHEHTHTHTAGALGQQHCSGDPSAGRQTHLSSKCCHSSVTAPPSLCSSCPDCRTCALRRLLSQQQPGKPSPQLPPAQPSPGRGAV